MKKIILTTLTVVAGLTARAGGSYSRAVRAGGNNAGGFRPALVYSGGSHATRYSSSWSRSGGHYGGSYHYPYRLGSHTYLSFSFGYPYPAYYWPTYSYPYAYYPGYAYAPGYAYDPAYSPGYAYSRPNYAVNGTLLGAGIGAIIGDNVRHQTWEGAAIGAGAGLLLGGLAEHGARVRERTAYAQPAVSYVQPKVQRNYVQDAPTVNNAPLAPAAPQIQNNTYRPAGTMGNANSFSGR